MELKKKMLVEENVSGRKWSIKKNVSGREC